VKQVGVCEVETFHIRIQIFSSTQIRAAQIYTRKITPRQVGAVQIRLAKISSSQVKA
jgi:hypothetical protein